MNIAITGIGVISSIGNTVDENLASLKASKSGISKVNGIQHLRKPYLGGQVSLSDQELKELLSIPFNKIIPRSALLSLVAAKQAWGNNAEHKELRTGLISATSVGGMELSEQFYFKLKDQNNWDLFENLAVHDNGAGTDIIAEYLDINTYKFTISTACSSGANAVLLGARLIEAGVLDRVLVGGGDAISNFTMNGFDSLGIYDTEWCKPFDNDRKGLNLGEGAGFVLLESQNSIEISGNKILAQVCGWANANDSFHQTASSPEGTGATLAVTQAIKKAEISADQIDYVNAHGTATPNNDLSESTALTNVFGDTIPPFSSTKAHTGHTLAASGGIETVFSVLAIQEDIVLPNLNHATPMAETGYYPVTKVESKKINFVLSNSFGFGGNSTSLVFSK